MSRTRRGFTLVELLMVIVVIGILSTLLVSGGMFVITSSREASTRSTVRILNQIIKDRQTAYWESLRDHAHGDYGAVFAKFKREIGPATTPEQIRIQAIRDAIQARIEAQAGLPTDPAWNERLAHTMLHIELERLFFPQTWEEADYLLALDGKPSISSDPASETENSEVLFWSLSEKSVVGTLAVDSDWIKPSMLVDKDNDGRKELVDAWGNLIRFYRWPTRILRPNGLPAGYLPRGMPPNFSPVPPADELLARVYFPLVQQSSSDPERPAGSNVTPSDALNLVANSYVQDMEISFGNTSVGTAAMEADYFLPSTFYKPVVVSPGQDGKHGLLNPVSKADFGYWGKIVPEDAIPEPMGDPVILENPGHSWIFDDIVDR